MTPTPPPKTRTAATRRTRRTSVEGKPEAADKARARAPRLSPEIRESIILDRAIEHFAAEGFSASTRELAQRIGVTHSLLYKYFPTKEALLDRVYERVYLDRLAAIPDDVLVDRHRPILARLKTYYWAYARAMLQGDWVRIFMFSGLKGAGISDRLFALIRARIFLPVLTELHSELGVSTPDSQELELRVELVWALHASIFYLGIRKWIFQTPVPDEIDSLIEALVDAFYSGFKTRCTSLEAAAAPKTRRRSSA